MLRPLARIAKRRRAGDRLWQIPPQMLDAQSRLAVYAVGDVFGRANRVVPKELARRRPVEHEPPAPRRPSWGLRGGMREQIDVPRTRHVCVRISAIVDTHFNLIVDAVSA